MATLTGVGGGIIRDSLVREIPIVLKEDLYATLCIVGGMLYYVFKVYTKIPEQIYSNGIILLIFILRIIAIKYKLSLPRKKNIY